jgi:hypothetical protein
MAGIFDLIFARGALDRLSGGDNYSPAPTTPGFNPFRKDVAPVLDSLTNTGQQQMLKEAAQRNVFPVQSAMNAGPGAFEGGGAADVMARMGALSAPTAGASYDDPDTQLALQQAMQGDLPNMPDPYANTSNARGTAFQQQLAAAEASQPGILDRLGIQTDRPFARLMMGIGAAGSPDPIGTILKMKEAEREALAARAAAGKVKRTPIANGTAILEEYPDGTTRVVRTGLGEKPKAPAGYQYNDKGTLEPIPGGPKDQKALELSRSLDNNFVRLDTKAQSVLGAIDKALGQVGVFSAGPIGQATSWLGGTPGADLEATLDEIQANIGFAELEDMRKSSPTGGALGQVAVKELEFLQAVKGSLKQKQTPSQLKANLERVRGEFEASRQRLRAAYEADIASGLIKRGSQPGLEGNAPAPSAAPAQRGGSAADRARGYLD